jgi:acyl carrier protein
MPAPREVAMNASLAIKVRDLIAGHFRISRDRLTDRAHFRDDLKADRLDRLELMIAIEDRLTGLRFDDTVVDQLETVGDLMRVIAGLPGAGAIGAGALGIGATQGDG